MHNRPKDFVCHLKIVSFLFGILDRIFCAEDCVNSFDKIKLLLVNLSFSNCLSSVGIRCCNAEALQSISRKSNGIVSATEAAAAVCFD